MYVGILVNKPLNSHIKDLKVQNRKLLLTTTACSCSNKTCAHNVNSRFVYVN